MGNDTFKTGDAVAIIHRYGARGPYRIERETKTLYIVNGDRFRKSNNRQQGEFSLTYGTPYLVPADSALARRELRASKLRRSSTSIRRITEALFEDNENPAIVAEAITKLQAHKVLLEKAIENDN